MTMELTNLIPHIEALIFASDKPLTTLEITDLVNNALGFMDDKIELDQIEAGLEAIAEKYKSEFYPFEVTMSGGGWQFLTKKEYHKTVAQLNGEKFLKRLSAAAMETLAIIAYKQPVTKGEIEAIRGVSSDYAVQKLLEKELIIISGRNEEMVGHPLLYSTSKNFMDYFGINSPEDLPKIKEILADQVIEPTQVQNAAATESSDSETTTEPSAPTTDDSDVVKDEITDEATEANGEESGEQTEGTDVTDVTADAQETEEDTFLSVTESGELIEGEDNNDPE